jgi:hypothetical protein
MVLEIKGNVIMKLRSLEKKGEELRPTASQKIHYTYVLTITIFWFIIFKVVQLDTIEVPRKRK